MLASVYSTSNCLHRTVITVFEADRPGQTDSQRGGAEKRPSLSWSRRPRRARISRSRGDRRPFRRQVA